MSNPGQDCSWVQRDVHGCTHHFDFSLRFEQLILSVIPSVIFIIATCWRFLALSKSRTKTIRTKFRSFKLFTALSYAAAQLVLLVLWSRDPEHTGTLFDAAQLRTVLLLGHRTALSTILAVTLSLKLALLALEAASKARILRDPYQNSSPESVSGIISRALYWWTIPLLTTGYRRLLSSDDLFPVDESIHSTELGRSLNNRMAASDMSKRHALLRVCLQCFKKDIAAMVPARLALICFTYSQTFLLEKAVKFLSQPSSDESVKIGYGLIGATFFIYTGIAVANALYERRVGRTMIKLRGTLVASVFSQALVAADGVDTDNAAVTLMSTDVETILRVFAELNEAWARLIEVIVGIALLSRQVGAISVVPIVLALASTRAQTWVSSRIGNRRKMWNDATQKRVGATGSVLGSIQSVRISGLMRFSTEHLQSLRNIELQCASGFLKFVVGLNAIAVVPSIWSPVLTWIIYAIKARLDYEEEIDTAQAFTSLALLFLITTPTAKLLTILPRWAQASVCFERLQRYLCLATYNDSRDQISRAETHNPSILESYDVGDIALSTLSVATSGAAILVQHATISRSRSDIPLITDCSFEAIKGTITVIIGPPGSGKTTLLKALLGEVGCATGKIALATKGVAYCAQSPWVTDTTIAQYIKGPDEMPDDTWYKDVLRACELADDLRNQVEGDSTRIGSRGISLSGGQRARLALARAVYARKEILILDDILSAVDARTEAAIVNNIAIANSPFRRGNRTIIAVSHSAKLVDIADKVFRLEDGKLTALDRSQGHSLATAADSDNTAHARSEEGPRSVAHAATKPPSPETKQDMTRQTGDWSVYRYYFSTTSLLSLLLFASCSIGAAFCSSFTQVWLQRWTESGTSNLALYLTVFVALACSSMLVTSANMVVVFLTIMPSSASKLHQVLLDAVTRAPYSLFYNTDTGTILNKFSQDMSHVCNSLPTSLISTGNTLCETIASLVLISIGASYMGLTIPLVLVTIFFVQKAYLKTSRQLRYLDLERRSPLYSHFLETLEGVVTIRSLGWSEHTEKTNRRLLDESQAPAYLLYCVQRWLRLVLDMTTMALAVVVVALAVAVRDTTSPGRLALALTNILSFSQSLSRLITEWTTMETSVGSIARIRSFASDPDLMPEHEWSRSDSAAGLDARWPSQGSITLDRVYAQYETKDVQDRDCLRDISLEIQAGQKVSVCGRTGSGKTSLMLALFQVLPLRSGSIIIDGVDISTLSADQLQEHLIGVPQQAFIMPDSVRRNLDPSGRLSDHDLNAVLSKVALQEVIEQLGGLDAALDQTRLSQGQQQLFCLARALCRKRSGGAVIVLDEPTSNLDSDAHSLISELIRSEFRDCTVITIAHRVDTILSSDVVIFMDNAQVVGFGPPQRLLEENASFRLLCQS
ncbi:unnamed protein product [Zymoseptoria tritici ST99CH_1A5]|uniref:ABC transporter n=1 Tax=Zymoseptoria tritici ST99CH_1A5 TaxID=1276529 RepID=A0A1Y6LRG5_ZYMTR|nr:unnamed protein product [Zymoseptoria tritici ST99CH_1A5]